MALGRSGLLGRWRALGSPRWPQLRSPQLRPGPCGISSLGTPHHRLGGAAPHLQRLHVGAPPLYRGPLLAMRAQEG
eukprot:2160632-Alexandrium_andersonii.AAC.1